MGSRIQKALGWGITGLEYDPKDRYYVPNDSRVDVKRFYQRQNDGLLTNNSWLEWMTKRTDEQAPDSDESFLYTFGLHEAKDLVAQNKEEIVRNIVFEGEYGDTGTILVVPPGTTNFRHSDDPLDYYESYLNGSHMEPKIQTLDVGIYPWSVYYMRSDTGEQVSDLARQFRSYIKSVKESMKKKEYTDEEERAKDAQLIRILSKKLSDEIGFEGDFETAYDIVVPGVPLEIKELLAWSGIITDPVAGWKDFRPMLYTWWS